MRSLTSFGKDKFQMPYLVSIRFQAGVWTNCDEESGIAKDKTGFSDNFRVNGALNTMIRGTRITM